MKLAIAIILLGLSSLACKSQVMWQLKTSGVKTWYYADGDEFNSDRVDLGKWDYGPGWGNALPEQHAVFTYGENVYLAGGSAHFVLKKERRLAHVYPWEIDSTWMKKNNVKVEKDEMWFDYTLGQLFSKAKYKYGYFECRFKSNEERGCWPAFWLFGAAPNNEIDWFELKGERKDQLHVDVHCPNGCEDFKGGFLNLQRNWGGWEKADRSLAEGFNVVSGEWNEEYMIWYLNGAPLCYFRHRYEVPMWLILNTSIAMDNAPFSPGPDKTTKFPNEFLIDYVRVWTDKDTVKKERPQFARSDESMTEQDLQNKAKVKKVQKYIYSKKLLKGEEGAVTFLPLGNGKYSLTFACPRLKDASIQFYGKENVPVKQYAIKKPEYMVFDLSDLDAGTYKVKVKVFDKELSYDFTHEKYLGK